MLRPSKPSMGLNLGIHASVCLSHPYPERLVAALCAAKCFISEVWTPPKPKHSFTYHLVTYRLATYHLITY